MPPKKKPVTASNAVTQSSSATVAIPTTINLPTTSTTTTTATALTTAQKKIQWCWAGDSGVGASQDILIEYDSKVNSEIESHYQMHLLKPKVIKYLKFKLDKERYIDFKNMVQARYDDPNKMRTVERQEIVPGLALPPPTTNKTSKRRGKIINSDDSDTASEDNSSDSSDSDVSDDNDDDDDEDDEDYIARWFWAGDSNGGPSKGGGHQDIWVEYDDLSMRKKLEKAFASGKKKLKVDEERFVDFQNMLQRRYDDKSKRRNLKREDPLKVRPKKTLTKSQKISNAATALNAMAASHANTTTPTTTTTTTSTIPPTTTTTTTTSGKVLGKRTTSTLTSSTDTQKPTLASTMSTISISDIIKCPSTWTDVDSMNYKEVDVKPSENEFQWMSKLFSQTISSNHKGISTLSPIVFNDLKVTRVVRVQNPMLWVSYHARKQKILDDNNGSCPPIHSVITNIPGGPDLDKKANELFLFHGLNVSSVAGIAKFGFDPRFCSLDGMFGAGLYFAENSSKSNQYCHSGACTCSGFQATSCKCKASDEVCLLVCRVVMGDCLVENVFRGNGPGQFWNGRRTEPKKPNNINIYNSVIGESKPNYGPKAALQLREYIVYESSQVFVEYKVYFKRIK
ncbi:hypothetical protein ACTA71_006180 [Dictyostelium dimigraforme]